jgi:hypothetical protein
MTHVISKNESFGLKMFARMRCFGGFSVRGEFAMTRREANEIFFCESLAESLGSGKTAAIGGLKAGESQMRSYRK